MGPRLAGLALEFLPQSSPHPYPAPGAKRQGTQLPGEKKELLVVEYESRRTVQWALTEAQLANGRLPLLALSSCPFSLHKLTCFHTAKEPGSLSQISTGLNSWVQLDSI